MRADQRGTDREILRLAVPAFLALVAEPLFLLSDAAIVGHLGTPQLAGLGVAAVVLQTVVGLCVFLAYGTTASVARHLGAGDLRAALAQGVDGVWLAVVIGVVATVCRTTAARPSPASSGVPRWPTMAASESRNSGSATRARKAGTARRRISRSVPRCSAFTGSP